jgi:hypothetical protein
LPSPPVLIIEKAQEDFSELENLKPKEAISEQLPSLSLQQEDAPGYFTRSKHKRSISSTDEDERIHKVIRAMITVYAPEHIHSSTEESAFLAKEVSNIKIPKSYLDAIRNPANAQEWQEVIQEELRSLKENGIWKEVIPLLGANLVSMKWVFTIKTMVDGTIE